MNKREVVPYYRKCASAMEFAYTYIKTLFDVDKSVGELCKLRGYTLDGEQRKLLEAMQICYCTMSIEDEGLGELAPELGLTTKTERFLLDERFIIPVRDIIGNLVTLIGYYPDNKKYITVPAPFFSKDVLFFNIDHAYKLSMQKFNGVVFLVEGIFDCLSLRSIGLPVLATMGSTVSLLKKELLKIFKKVIYIPDNDAVGRRALNRRDSVFGWNVPDNATGIRLSGSIIINDEEGASKQLKIKDVDNLVSWFEAEDIRDMLLEYADCRDEVAHLDLGCIDMRVSA